MVRRSIRRSDAAATSVGVRVRVKTDPTATRIEEEAIGYDKWMPKGLEEGVGCVPMETKRRMWVVRE